MYCIVSRGLGFSDDRDNNSVSDSKDNNGEEAKVSARLSPLRKSSCVGLDLDVGLNLQTAPLLQSSRPNKLFVGGLNFETTTDTIQNYFSKIGEVTDVSTHLAYCLFALSMNTALLDGCRYMLVHDQAHDLFSHVI